MELEYFTRIDYIDHKEITIVMMTILKDLPTPLQWQFSIESIRENFEKMKNNPRKFAFIMDLRKIGRLSISQIKDFVHLMESYTSMLQECLIATSIFTSKNSILATLFEILKQFYQTKKPIKFVYDLESAYEHIDSFDNKIIKDNYQI